MKATLLQRNVLWADPEGNAAANSAIMESLRGTDLFVLPEMFSTGSATSPEGIAEELDPKGECFTQRWMRKEASRLDCAVCGSVAVKERDGRFYNRLYFVTPDMSFSYDKHHLFTYGGENLRYSAGQERVVVFWRGVRILLQVCYDVRFPVFVRNGIADDGKPEYDAIIYVASWPAKRVPAWKKLLPARAIENQCYVLAVNRMGNDPVCEYIGGTMVIDAMGNVVDSCPEGKETSISVDLDMEALNRFRSKFPVLEDGDGFCMV